MTDQHDYDPEQLPTPLPRGVTMMEPGDHEPVSDQPWGLQLGYDHYVPEGWQVLLRPGSAQATWSGCDRSSSGGNRWVRPAPPVQAGDIVRWDRHEIPRRVLTLVPGYSLAVVEDAPNDRDCQADRQQPPSFAPTVELTLIERPTPIETPPLRMAGEAPREGLHTGPRTPAEGMARQLLEGMASYHHGHSGYHELTSGVRCNGDVHAGIDHQPMLVLYGDDATAQGQAGDRALDAGEWGTLVKCGTCGGGGLLHKPDHQPEPTTPTEPDEERCPRCEEVLNVASGNLCGCIAPPAEEPAWHVVTELPRPTLPGWVSSHDGRTKLRAHSVARIETVVNRTSAAITAYAYDGALVQMVRISTRGEVPSEAAAILDGEAVRMAEAIEHAVAETEPVVMALIEQGDPAMTIEIDVEDDRGE